MRRRLLLGLLSLPVPAMLLLAPVAVSAQGASGGGNENGRSQTMASPSSEGMIPKGSNPEGGSGNLGPSSGATPPSSASDQSTPPQTADSPDVSNSDAASGNDAAPANGAAAAQPDSMPQGKYASPPTPDD